MRLSAACCLLAAAAAVLLLGQSEAHSSCFGSVGGGGHIYQFDGGVVSLAPNYCNVLLARSRLRFCNLLIYASFSSSRSKRKHANPKGVTCLRKMTVIIDGKRFELLRNRQLAVNGHLRNVPYSEPNVRVFMSGDDIVFTHKKCGAWVTYNGVCTSTFRMSGSLRRGRVAGLAGNCDGNSANDPSLTKGALKSWYKKRWLSRCKLSRRRLRAGSKKWRGCHSYKEYHRARLICSRVIKASQSCKSTSVLTPCVRDFCATRNLRSVQRAVLCENFYLHSRRCARHNRPLSWRGRAGCPEKCGKNQHFSSKISPCQESCDSHFFGKPKSCFKLRSSEGCRCNPGFVLDGANCVHPRNCVCLAKLCIDRQPHKKCAYWKALGRCKTFSNFMSNNCRLTCGLCRPQCKNQISNKLCAYFRRKGKCRDSFYRAMCQATCNPRGCGCPPPRSEKSACSPKYRNQVFSSKKWWPDRRGVCRKSILIRYRACGVCRRIRRITRGRCNYCKRVKYDTKVLQYREKYGKRRCIRRVRRLRRSCACARRPVSFLRCERNRVLVRITKFWAITGRCLRCVRRTTRVVIRSLRGCKGTFTVGKCKGNSLSIVKTTYKKIAQKCKCIRRVVRRRRWQCRCRATVQRRVCRNTRWQIITKYWQLRYGRCIARMRSAYQAIRCPRRARRWNTCIRKSCKALRHLSYYYVKKCRCRRYNKSTLKGKCCCPKGYRRTVRINRYFKKIITVIYKLVKYKCRKIVRVRKVRIACRRGGSYVKCIASRGVKMFVSWRYVLSGNSCTRKYTRRKSRIQCRRSVKRIAYKCSIMVGHVKYRRVKLIYSRRRGCICVRRMRVVREMCGCRPGRFLRVIKCPSGCRAKACSSRCRMYKVFYYYAAKGRRCVRRIFKRLAFRCCCKKNRRVTKRCKNNNILQNKVCVTVLKNGKCQRLCKTSSRRIRCRSGTVSSWQPHSNKNLRYRVTKTFFTRNCRCGVRVQRRVCKSRCRPAIKRKFCDHVRRQRVSQRISWKLSGCKRCSRRVQESRIRVKCRSGVKRWRVCKRNGVLFLHSIKFWQSGCKCFNKKYTRTLRCRCRSPMIGAARCISNYWVRRVKTWNLRNGRCVLRIRSRRVRVRCGSSRKYRRVCNRKTGVEVKFLGVLRPKNCKCIRAWSRIAKRRCNCIADNRRVEGKVSRYCRRNRKITVRYYYILRNGRCVLRNRKSSRGIRCRRPFTVRRKCNLAKKKQLHVMHRFVKRNCRCVLVKKNIWRPCGCNGKLVIRTKKCKHSLGLITTVTVTKKWSHRRNICLSVRAVHSRRVACRRRTVYKTGSCIKNKYYIVRKIFYFRRGCRCYRRVRRLRLNCHCKNITKRYKCKKNRYFRRVVIQLRKWNMKKRRCYTYKYVTRKIRCRCPRGFVKRLCSNGFHVKKIVRYVLQGVNCRRTMIVRRRRIVCRGKIRLSYTKCSKCNRYKLTLAPRLNRKTCTCYYAVAKRQRCTCCCPRTQKRTRCEGNHYVTKYTYYAPYTGRKCSLRCRSWHSTRRLRVPCRRRRRLRWLPCNRRSCVSKQQLIEYRLSRCKCILYRRLTGRKRTCCCRANRRTRRVCLNSCLFAKVTFTKFVPWLCVRAKRMRLLRVWKCRGRIGTVIGRCNKRTCKQSVQDEVSVVDRPYCRCKTLLRNLRYRACCCNRKPVVTRKCLGRCWRTTAIRFAFNLKRRVCVRKIKRSLSCVRCAPNRRLVSRCNRRTCRKKITRKFYIVKRCRCIPKYRYSYRVCCCRRPRTIGPICASRGRLMWRTISWNLRAGRCVRKETRRYRLIRCRGGVRNTRVLQCNRATCKQRVKRMYLILRGCTCRKTWRTSTRICCCRPARRQWTRCERNRQLVQYTVTQTLYRWRRCIVRRQRRVLRSVSSCRRRVVVGACNRKTRKRVVTIISRAPRNCRCANARVVRKLVLCRCPPLRVTRSKCNRKTCHKVITKVWFTSNAKGHGVRCTRHIRKYRLRCCCHRRQTQRRFCDQTTGSIKLKAVWYVFLQRSRSCALRQSIRTIRRLRCTRTSCKISRCSRKSGYKTKVCVHYSPVRSLCKCRKNVTRHRIVCSCRRKSVVRKCENNNRQVTLITRWKIHRRLNRCVRAVSRVARDIRCSRRKRIVRKCGKKCKGVKVLYYRKVQKCKCVLRSRRWKIACCCPRTRCVTRCHGNRYVTTCTRYVLRRDRCVRHVKQRTRTISCRRTRVRISKCRGCKFSKVFEKFAVRRCRCVRARRIVKNLRCCCPRSRRRRFCRNGRHIKQTVSYKLVKHRCLRRVREKKYTIQCRRPTVQVSGCNTNSRRRKIVVTKFFRRGCRCVMRRQIRYEVCMCKRAFVIREKCAGKSRRRVFKISFQLIRRKGKKPFCRKLRRILRFEPCRCAPSRRHSRCIGNRKVLTVVTKWRLVNRYSRNVCVSKAKSYEKIIRCRRRSVTWSKCSHFKKVRTIVYYKPVKCRCRKYVIRRTYACNCSLKNTRRTLCDSRTGRIIKLRKEFFAKKGSRRCSFTIRRKIIRVICRRAIRTVLLSRRCAVKKWNGYYTGLLQKWKIRRGCKCVRRSRKLLKLCRCRRSSTVRRCVNGRTRRRILVKYVRRRNRCRRTQRIWNTTVRCRTTRPRIRFGGCNTRLCKRSATVTQCFVRSCRTLTYRRSGLQRCCAPKRKVRKYCDKKRGQFVTVTTVYRLSPSKALLKDRNGNVVVRQKRVISRNIIVRRNVRCPRNQRRETCSRSGIWRKILIVYNRVGCGCRRRRVVRTGKCRCPLSRSTFGKCIKRYKTKTTIIFKLVARKCLRFVRRRKYLCACRPRRTFTVCDRRGNWKTCQVAYKLQFRRQRCLRSIRCIRRRQTCSGIQVHRSRCRKFKQKLTITRWVLNKRKCKCVKVVKSKIVGCNCSRWRYNRVLCVSGRYITKRVTHYLKNHRCVRRVRTDVRRIRCSTKRRVTVVPGSCVTRPGSKKRGYQKLRIDWQVKTGCKCIRRHSFRYVPCRCKLIRKYRTRGSRACVRGNVRVTNIKYYTLRRFTCVRRVRYIRRVVRCRGTRSVVSKCKLTRRGDSYKIRKTYKRVSNGRCGCTWKVSRVQLRVCSCRKSVQRKLCLRHKIQRLETWRFVPVAGKGYCRRIVQRRDRLVRCKRSYWRRSKCRKCVYYKHLYAYKHVKCGCQKYKVRSVKLRCCCLRPMTTRTCDARRNIITVKTVSYTLNRGTCSRKLRYRSVRVRCRRRMPIYRFGKCKGGYRIFYRISFYEAKCSCMRRTRRYRQKCTCSKKLILRKGKCGKWFAIDSTLGWKLVKLGRKIAGTSQRKFKCVRVVVSRRRRRCRCPNSTRTRRCLGDRIRTITVRYHLRGNSCQRRRTVTDRRLPCSTRTKLLRVRKVRSSCSRKYKYAQLLKYYYVRAIKCKCVRFTRVKSYVCNCYLRNGGTRTVRKCLRNKLLLIKKSWYVNVKRKCVRRVRIQKRAIKCSGRKVVRGKCRRNRRRTYTILRRVARNCGCVWRVQRRVTVSCLCRASTRTVRCRGNAVVTQIRKWNLIGRGLTAKCKLTVRNIVRKIPCRVGSFTKRTKCSAGGLLKIIRITRALRKCRCVQKVRRIPCRCRCRRSSRRTVCSRNRLVTITHDWKLRNCRCYGNRTVRRRPVRCPRRRRILSACTRRRNGDRYKTLKTVYYVLLRCKCIRKIISRNIRCGCDSRLRRVVSCRGGNVRIITVTKRKLVRGRCTRVRVSRRSVKINCGRMRVRKTCNRKTGVFSIFVVKPFVKACKCKNTAYRFTRRCRCDSGSRLSRRGKCNRSTCRRRLLMKKQVLKGMKCVWKYFHKSALCCCRGGRNTRTCLRSRGVYKQQLIKYVLQAGRCVRSVRTKYIRIRCSGKVSIRKRRLSNGILKIVRCKIVRRGCQCRPSCRTTLLRYKCYKNRIVKRCECSKNSCRNVIYVTSWRLVSGKCYRKSRRIVRQLQCGASVVARSKCRYRGKHGWYSIHRKTQWKMRNCRCVKSVRQRRVMCRCLRRQRRTTCDTRRGLTIRTEIKYRLTADRKSCKRIVKVVKRRVSCDSRWRLVRTHRRGSRVIKKYRHFVRSGCRCVARFRKISCIVRCPRCRTRRRCKNDKTVEVIRVCWRLSSCVCKRQVKVSHIRVRCAKRKVIRSCNRRNCVRTTKYITHFARNCKCKSSLRVHRTRCCCRRPQQQRVCRGGTIRIRRIQWHLVSGQCRPKTIDRYLRIRCPTSRRTAIYGRCVRGKRKYAVHYWIRKGCRCIRKVRIILRPCTCARKAIDLMIAIDLYDKKKSGYKPGIKRLINKICATMARQNIITHASVATFGSQIKISRKIKIPTRKLSLIANQVFKSGRTDLEALLRKTNRVISKRSKKSPHPVVVLFSCGRHRGKAAILRQARKLQRVASVIVVQIGKSTDNNKYLRLVASKPRRYNYITVSMKELQNMDTHKFTATKVFDQVCKRSCRKSFVRRSRCHRRSCKRVYTRVSYSRNSQTNRCVRRVRSWRRDCCCSRRSRMRVVCHRNRRIKLVVRYSFSLRRELCSKHVYKVDITAPLLRRCRPRVRAVRGKCNGKWRFDVIVKRRFINCGCRVSRKQLRVRCGCPRPRIRQFCRNGREKVRCVTSYVLRGSRCIPRSPACTSLAVVCRAPSKHVSKCSLCIRTISKVWYIRKNCRCYRRISAVRRRCCCSRKVQRYSYCDRKRNRNVTVIRSQKLVNGSCKKVTRRTYRTVTCRRAKKITGRCLRQGSHYYRKVTVLRWTRKNCACVQTRKAYVRLCRCNGSRTARKCSSGRIVHVKQWWQLVSGKCVRRTRIVSRRIITCSSRRRKSFGSCSIIRKGLRYRKVIIRWQRRVACKCVPQQKVLLQLCSCRRSYRRVSCLRGDTQVTTVYRYKLYAGRCILYKRTYRKRIICQFAKNRTSRCVKGRRTVTVTTYRPVACTCKAHVYRKTISCKSGCRDLLPKRVCRKWASSKLRLCDRYPHYASKYCSRTCGLCYGCLTTTMVYAGRVCLHKQAGFRSEYSIGKAKTLKSCLRMCHRNKRCRAFSFKWHSRKCILFSVTRSDLLARSKIYNLRTGGRCLLFEKVCPKRCPYRRFEKQYRCRCKMIAGRKVCYRILRVATFVRDRSGRCRRRVKNVQAPCRICEDRTHTDWCVKHRLACNQPQVKHQCPLTCGMCKRKPLVLTQKGKCRSGKKTIVRMQKFFDKKTSMWRVRHVRTTVACVRCAAGAYTIVGECINGKRKVTRVVARQIGGRCKVLTRTKIFPCRGCAFSLRRVIGHCRRHGRGWRRKVVTFFTVRRRKRCVVLRDIRIFNCSPKCPRDSIRSSRCHCGKQISCVKYFVTFPGSSICVPKTHSFTRICTQSVCRNHMRMVDCLLVKRKGMCRMRKMRHLCARTCGVCK